MTKVIWTEELKKELVSMYNKGIAMRVIANKFHTTENNIKTVLSRIRTSNTLEILDDKKWTAIDIEKLVTLVVQGMSYKKIAIELNKKEAAIKYKLALLKQDIKYKEILPSKKNLVYTKQELDNLITLFNKNTSIENIAKELNRSIASISNKIHALKVEGKIFKTLKKDKYTDEQLVNFIKLYKSKDQCPGDIRYCIISRFKSWTAALKFANISGNIGGVFDPSLNTTLYLLYFEEENFYKVGITQRDIKVRFRGAPNYIVVDQISDELEFIVNTEKLILNSISNKYIPINTWFIRNGSTECFKSNTTIKNLLSLLG